ncbi:hypothetical protein DICSQDRAFT_169469 [Dichomitus squalens LYAD-421 SS1]|uniref:Uncharacterized protein n=1 Tax=Dichomitus squalens (strain LYAD-421) TaxID=732165 RepID=R7T0B8_DICSQ|nr:uncharacterized protein DICSQDRAFT_169469 [Dichomitus squalens LYAD-421 SS1]EJF61889.1 hypothetical protein DICSQDRAFT_169469 [Dichomitus squalens LYAD-421 SS1]
MEEMGNNDNSGPDSENTAIAMLPPDRHITLPALDMASELNVAVWRAYEISSGSTDRCAAPQYPPNFTLRMHPPTEQEAEPFLTKVLYDLVGACGRSPLKYLAVRANHRYGTTAAWTTGFRTFPLLEELCISGETDYGFVSSGSMQTVFVGLHAASVDWPESPLACPNLEIIDVKGKGTEAAYVAMCNCLRYRAEKGAVLEELWLDFPVTDSSSAVVREYVDILMMHTESVQAETGA